MTHTSKAAPKPYLFHPPFQLLGYPYLVTCLIITAILIFNWFHSGYTLMGAEEGPIFLTPTHTFSLYRSIWTDSGLGLANPLIVARLPFYLLIDLLANINLTGLLIQQLTFASLLLVPLLSVPYLVQEYFPQTKKADKVTAIFYLFNLYTMSQVWSRFIYPQIFLWSYFPLFLWLWTKWLKTGKLRFILWLCLSSFAYCLMFSFLSTALVLWVSATLVGIFLLLEPSVKLIQICLRGIGGFTLWALSNVWWTLPLLGVSQNNYSTQLDPAKNLIALTDVSKYFPNSSLILLQQDYLFHLYTTWTPYLYQNSIPLIILGLATIGLLAYLKTNAGRLFACLLFVGWMVSKGTNPPGGQPFFEFLFSHFPVTQILRNPYEKFGIVFVLPYAIFFGLGLTKIFGRSRFLLIVSLIILCGLSTQPLWSGYLFGRFTAQPPVDYAHVNQLLSQTSTHRLLSLPFLNTANVTYNWGYQGEEMSELFLDQPTLSRTYNDPSDIYPLLPQFFNSPNFSRLFPLLAIDHVIIHHDAPMTAAYSQDAAGAENLATFWHGLVPVYSGANLTLYQYHQPVQWAYLAAQFHSVDTPSQGFDQIITGQLNPMTEFFVLKPTSLTPIQTSALPSYSVHKLAADHYQIQINQANSPFYLILSTTFNPNWQAKINQSLQSTHFLANGYSNGWYLTQAGSYLIDLQFQGWPRLH